MVKIKNPISFVQPIKTLGGEYNIDQIIDGDECELVITTADGKSKSIILPLEFGSSQNIYYFKVNNEQLLISANTTNVGLWLYDITNETITQLHNIDSSWRNFQQVTDTKILIGSATTTGGILLFDINSKLCRHIYNAGLYWGNFFKVSDDKWLIGGNGSGDGGSLLYNSATDEIKKIARYGAGFSYYKMSDNITLMYGGGSDGRGVWVYNDNTETLTQDWSYKTTNISVSGNYGRVIDETKFIFNTNSGLLMYTLSSNSFKMIYENGSDWRYCNQVTNTKYLFSGYTSGYTGMLVYNSEDDSVLRINEGYYGLNTFINIGNVCLIVADSSNCNGVFLYDSTDNSIVLMYDKSYRWTSRLLFGNNCVLSTTNSGTGCLVYNGTKKTVKQIVTTDYNWKALSVNDNKIVVFGGSNKVYSYTLDDETLTLLSSNDGINYAGRYHIIDDVKYLIYGASSGNGITLYNSTNDTVTKLTSIGTGYDKIIKDGKKYYLSANTVNSTNPYTLLYDSEDDSCRIYSYYIEEL